MTKLKLEDIQCLNCDTVGQIKHVARATWICQNCQKDNSINVVLMYQAVEGEG